MFSIGTESAAKPAERATLASLPGRLAAVLEDERAEWAHWIPVGLGIGIGLYFVLPQEPPLWPAVLTMVLGVGTYVWARGDENAPSLRSAAGFAAAGLAFAGLGFAAAILRTQAVGAPMVQKRTGSAVLSGCIEEIARRSDGGWRLVVGDVQMDALTPAETPRRVSLIVRGSDVTFGPGACFRVRAVLTPPPRAAAPDAFDFQRRAFFDGIGAYGFGVGKVIPVERRVERSVFAEGRLAVERLRRDLFTRITASLPGESGGLAAALIMGDRSAIPEPVTVAMRDSGLAHLISISGLHVGLVAGLLFFGVRAALALIPGLALRYPIKKWAAAVAFVGAVIYLAISGASVPTQRAVLMLSLVLLATVTDRNAISMRVVVWAAVVILLLTPEALLDAGAQMSFAAVMALVAVYEALVRHGDDTHRLLPRPTDSWLRRVGLYMLGVAVTTLVASLATSPFAAFHFNRVATFGLVANLVAVPVTGLWIMPWAIIAMVLFPLGLEGWALVPLGWGVEAVIAAARWTSGLPGAVETVASVPAALLFAVVAGGLWLCLWRRRWRLAGLPLIVAGALIWPFAGDPPDVLVADNGHMVLVRGQGGPVLLSGGKTDSFIAESWLRRLGQPAESLGRFPSQREEPLVWPGGRAACDARGCLYVSLAGKVALAHDPAALADDCRAADLVVSREPVRQFCGAPVIDWFDVWREGAHAVWLERSGVRIRTVRQTQGERPWTTWPARQP